MAFWNTWIDNFAIKRAQTIVSRLWPVWDTGALQYPTQNPYVLANEGFAKNELIYACVNRIANAVAEAPMWVFDDSGETPEEVSDHALRQLIKHPAPNMTEEDFWRITEIYLKVAGFCVWEKIRNRYDEVVELGLMRPDWISFKRGKDRMIDQVVYSPPGYTVPGKDADEFVILMYFDPRNPLSKGLSPTAIAMRVSSVDNAATDFLKLFFQHGAIFNGLLTTDQRLSQEQADRIRDGWKIRHGGVQNWSDIAVIGQGVKYEKMQMNFNEMAFDSLDSRSEARICTVFNIPPIVVGTLTGLAAGTHHNYQEAKLAFYQDNVKPEWRFLAGEIREQLLPDFEGESSDKFYMEFQVADIASLQEDRDAQWKRADDGYKGLLIARDEGRDEMGLDPVDEDWLVFANGEKKPKPGTSPQMETTAATIDVTPQLTAGEVRLLEDGKSIERRQFHAFAAKRLREGNARALYDFSFKYLSPDEQFNIIKRYKSNGHKSVIAPRDFKRILLVNSFEGSHPSADDYWRREARKVADILNTRLPTNLAFIRQPTEIETVIAAYDPQDTLIIDWTDSEVASEIIENNHFAHTASSPSVASLMTDRAQIFLKLRSIGVRTPDFKLISTKEDLEDIAPIRYPALLRPNEVHGSEDLCPVSSLKEAAAALDGIFKQHKSPAILVEKVGEREFSVGLWSDGRTIEAFKIAEGDFKGAPDDIKGEDDKAELGPAANELNQIPAQIPADLEKILIEQSRNIFTEFGFRLYARIDWRMWLTENEPICIDPNCEPEMTEPSLMALMAKSSGMDYTAFVNQFLDRAIAYYHALDYTSQPIGITSGNGQGAQPSDAGKFFRAWMEKRGERRTGLSGSVDRVATELLDGRG